MNKRPSTYVQILGSSESLWNEMSWCTFLRRSKLGRVQRKTLYPLLICLTKERAFLITEQTPLHRPLWDIAYSTLSRLCINSFADLKKDRKKSWKEKKTFFKLEQREKKIKKTSSTLRCFSSSVQNLCRHLCHDLCYHLFSYLCRHFCHHKRRYCKKMIWSKRYRL